MLHRVSQEDREERPCHLTAVFFDDQGMFLEGLMQVQLVDSLVMKFLKVSLRKDFQGTLKTLVMRLKNQDIVVHWLMPC